MAPCVIGVDIGTTGVKGIALGKRGRVLATAHHEHHLSSPFPGWAEERPADWWQGAVRVLRRLLSAVRADQVAVVGVSGMVPALVLLDGAGSPLRPSIQQNDARTDKEMAWLRARLPEDTLLRVTGCAITQQLIPTKLLWLRTHEPAVYRRIRWIMGSYDYVNYRLTGRMGLEQNWAIESGLWMAAEHRWYPAMLDLFETPQAWLGPVHAPHERIGEISPQAARDTGLRPGTPVIAGSADHIAAALASGITEKGDLVLKFGGAGDILYCLDQFSPTPLLFIDYHDIPGKYVISGCMASSGSVVKWFKNLLGGGPRAYAALDRGAAPLPCGSDGLLALPYFLGEKTPFCDPLARGVLFGLGLHHTKYHIHRAILESIVYAFRHHAEVIRDMGYPVGRILAVDQGARSGLWRQITADIFAQPVWRVRGGDLGSVYGTALVAGVTAGFWDWGGVTHLSQARVANHPRPEAHGVYEEMYRLYRGLYGHVKADLHRLARIGATPGKTLE